MHTRRSIVVATAGLLAYQLGAHVAPSINNAAVTLNHAAAVNRASVEMNEDAAKAAWLAKQSKPGWSKRVDPKPPVTPSEAELADIERRLAQNEAELKASRERRSPPRACR